MRTECPLSPADDYPTAARASEPPTLRCTLGAGRNRSISGAHGRLVGHSTSDVAAESTTCTLELGPIGTTDLPPRAEGLRARGWLSSRRWFAQTIPRAHVYATSRPWKDVWSNRLVDPASTSVGDGLPQECRRSSRPSRAERPLRADERPRGIAAELGVAPMTLCRHVARQGLPARRGLRPARRS